MNHGQVMCKNGGTDRDVVWPADSCGSMKKLYDSCGSCIAVDVVVQCSRSMGCSVTCITLDCGRPWFMSVIIL